MGTGLIILITIVLPNLIQFYLPFEHIFFIVEPTSAVPSTAVSRMAVPSTSVSRTAVPRTAAPSTSVPTTAVF